MVGPMDSFCSERADLLDSGEGADAEIRCHGMVIPVHKDILCAKSAWFRDAFSDDSEAQGAEHTIIDIANFTPGEVTMLIRWIYTGHFWLGPWANGETKITISLKAFKLAGNFSLDELKEDVIWSHRDFLKCWAMNSGDHVWPDLRKVQPVEGIVQSLKALYECDSDEIRDNFLLPFLAVLLLDSRILAKQDSFKQLVRDIPQFAEDWALGLMGSLGFAPKPLHPLILSKCGNCEKMWQCMNDPVKAIKENRSVRHCPECFHAPTWENWVG